MLPQLSCAGIGMACFRGRLPFDGLQHRARGTPKFELLLQAFGGVRQQRQLVQPLVQLRHRFRHRRPGGGPLTGLAPIGDRSFDESGLGVMPREKFGLAVHQLGRMGFERFGDLRMQLLPRAPQQAAMRRVLHQRVLEAIDRVGRRAPLEHQLGTDKPTERSLQLLLRKTGDGAQQRIGKFASDRRAICATSRTDPRRSSRDISELCKLVGIANGGSARSRT